MLNAVDPIGRGELSYLEFYNCCYSSTAICLRALIIHVPWILLAKIYSTCVTTKYNLQVTK